jgi:hypothetical protein
MVLTFIVYDKVFAINCSDYVSLQTLLPVILSHFPAGSSLKSWIHYGQLIRSGKFKDTIVTLLLGSFNPAKFVSRQVEFMLENRDSEVYVFRTLDRLNTARRPNPRRLKRKSFVSHWK